MMVHGVDVTTGVLLALAGVLAGFLNTVASGGSALTLPAIIALGLDPVMANATNRVPIVLGCAVAVWKFHQAGQLPWRLGARLSAPLAAGGLIGVILAANLSEMRTGWLTTLAVVLAAVVVLFNPAKWLHADRPQTEPNTGWLVLALLLAVGFWGGLIAVDSATFALAALVLVAHLPIREANAVKVLGLGLVALIGVVVFTARGQIDWLWAIPLSVGGMAGSLLGARVSLGPHASRWIFWILVGGLGTETLRLGLHYL
jgi:uncharacterized membrane protein YfcA